MRDDGSDEEDDLVHTHMVVGDDDEDGNDDDANAGQVMQLIAMLNALPEDQRNAMAEQLGISPEHLQQITEGAGMMDMEAGDDGVDIELTQEVLRPLGQAICLRLCHLSNKKHRTAPGKRRNWPPAAVWIRRGGLVRGYFLVFVPTIREIRDFYRDM
eukprot:SAG31_NODE_15289_length_762_cov_1.066365_1_plen_157_part_00